jgi:hypothetical protein
MPWIKDVSWPEDLLSDLPPDCFLVEPELVCRELRTEEIRSRKDGFFERSLLAVDFFRVAVFLSFLFVDLLAIRFGYYTTAWRSKYGSKAA